MDEIMLLYIVTRDGHSGKYFCKEWSEESAVSLVAEEHDVPIGQLTAFELCSLYETETSWFECDL